MSDVLESTANIISLFLIEEDIGYNPEDGYDGDWPIFTSFFPDDENTPDQIITVYDTKGIKKGRLQPGETVIDPGFQVRVRANDYLVGYRKIAEIAAAFDEVYFFTVATDLGDFSIELINQGSIIPLGTEPDQEGQLSEPSRRLPTFTLNCLATITPL
jgi:hypothetical protein